MDVLFWLLILGSWLFKWLYRKKDPAGPIRGRRLLTIEEVKREKAHLLSNEKEGLFWGGIWLQPWAAFNHFCVIGTTGSGKTLTMRLLMQSLLPKIGPGSDSRAIIYDGKQDVISQLYGMGVTCPVDTLHPFDIRGSAWAISRDCSSVTSCQQFAAVIFPDSSKDQNRFFEDAPRDITSGILESLSQTCPGKWDLRDVILIARDRVILEDVLSRTPSTQRCRVYFREERTFANIHSSLATRLTPFEPIAACWDRAAARVSLGEWLRNERVYVLGNDDSARFAIDAINRMIVQRASEMVLGLPESQDRKMIFFFDEVREAGKLPGLSRLLTKGRTKGCIVALGFQDVDGFTDVHGEHVANEILGQCSNKAILRLESHRTGDWGSKMIGSEERIEPQYSKTTGPNGESESTNFQRVNRELVLTSDFLNIPPTNPQNGLTGYYLSPGIGAYHSTIDGPTIARLLRAPGENVPNFIPRPPEHQILRPFTDEDLHRLGLDGLRRTG